MLDPLQVGLLLIGIIVVLILITNIKAGEAANRIAKRYCRQHELQFLDGTVAMGSMSIIWQRKPFIFELARNFRFEYSTNSVDRWQASLCFSGDRIQTVTTPHDLELQQTNQLKN